MVEAYVLGDENVLLFESAGGDPVVKRDIDGPRYAFFHPPANMKGVLFEQSDEAALEAEETGGADDGGLHELVELAGRAQFKRNFENLVQLMGLSAGHAIQLGVGNRNGPKSSEGGDQGFVFLSEGFSEARIDQNCAVRA